VASVNLIVLCCDDYDDNDDGDDDGEWIFYNVTFNGCLLPAVFAGTQLDKNGFVPSPLPIIVEQWYVCPLSKL